jgi:hypothetical protein
MGGWLAQALCVAAKLDIAEALRDGPRAVDELASELACNEDGLARLLRALEQHGVFRKTRDGRFAQTSMSNCLRKDAPLSIRDFALYTGSAAHREHWSELERSIQSGEPSIEHVRGSSFFEYTRSAPEFGALFDQAMTGLSALAQEALLIRYEFARFRTVVDVGGGQGRLLGAILQRTPGVRGVLYDLPEVVATAPTLLQSLGVLERCDIVAGSFLGSVPTGGQAYVLKHILHDWPDSDALEILRHVRRAIAEDGTLLLFESVVTTDGSPHLAKLTDLEMLLCLGGRERTRAEFAALLHAAGFSLTRVIETAAPISILEATCTNES